jgi:hypothetical protein
MHSFVLAIGVLLALCSVGSGYRAVNGARAPQTPTHLQLKHPKQPMKQQKQHYYTRLRTSAVASSGVEPSKEASYPAMIPRNDALDKVISKLTVPAVLNLAILPLVGAADTFWVGRMGDAFCLAGQGAANQIFNSAFWICSFLPNIVTPLIAKAAGSGDQEEVRLRVNEAFFVAAIMGNSGVIVISSCTH